jgi:hypothetical protein
LAEEEGERRKAELGNSGVLEGVAFLKSFIRLTYLVCKMRRSSGPFRPLAMPL